MYKRIEKENKVEYTVQKVNDDFHFVPDVVLECRITQKNFKTSVMFDVARRPSEIKEKHIWNFGETVSKVYDAGFDVERAVMVFP